MSLIWWFFLVQSILQYWVFLVTWFFCNLWICWRLEKNKGDVYPSGLIYPSLTNLLVAFPLESSADHSRNGTWTNSGKLYQIYFPILLISNHSIVLHISSDFEVREGRIHSCSLRGWCAAGISVKSWCWPRRHRSCNNRG